MKLIEHMAECVSNTQRTHIDRMSVLGVDPSLFWDGPAAWGVGCIKPTGNTFEFDPDGFWACVVPACDDYRFDGFETSLIDLVAFRTDKPSQWWTLRDTAPLLGLEAVSKAHRFGGLDEVLAVYESPLSWLQAGRQGATILDWRCTLPFWLGGVRRIWCETPSIATRITKRLSAPVASLPEIRTQEARNAA